MVLHVPCELETRDCAVYTMNFAAMYFSMRVNESILCACVLHFYSDQFHVFCG